MRASWIDDFCELSGRCGRQGKALWVESEQGAGGALWRGGKRSPALAEARRRAGGGPGLIAVWLGGAGWVDAVATPIDRGAWGEAAGWAALAARAGSEGGAAALARFHHRRMEDLFIAWCDELCEAGAGAVARAGLGALKASGRLGPAFRALEAGHDPALWGRLAPHAPRRLGVRWRLHEAFLGARPPTIDELREACERGAAAAEGRRAGLTA